MNGYERIMAALRLEQPDRVPIFELLINEPVIHALYSDLSTDSEFQRGTQGGYHIQADFIEREDIDAITIFEDGRVEWTEASGSFHVQFPSFRLQIWGGCDETTNTGFVAVALRDNNSEIVDDWVLEEDDAEFEVLQELLGSAKRRARNVYERT